MHLCLQVVADNMRGGRVNMMGINGLDIPSKFACWASLATTQLLIPQASMTGHLCGVIAGLAHVYIPRAGAMQTFPLPSMCTIAICHSCVCVVCVKHQAVSCKS